MYYLLCSETTTHVDYRYIIGIADGKEELFELTWNYISLMRDYYEYTYEIHSDKLVKHKIMEEQYNTLSQLYEKYKDKIEEQLDIYEDGGFKNETVYTSLWYTCYYTDGVENTSDLFFSKDDCKIIYSIIDSK